MSLGINFLELLHLTPNFIHVFKVRPHPPRHAPTSCPTATLMTSPCVPVPTTRPGQPTIAENSVDMSCVHVRFHSLHIHIITILYIHITNLFSNNRTSLYRRIVFNNLHPMLFKLADSVYGHNVPA